MDALHLEVSTVVDAPVDAVWDLVTDITRMGDWSPECYRCVWTGGATGPAVGARFRGYNRRGWVLWFTTPRVTRCEPGQVFAFRVPQSDAEWEYRFEADGGGTRLTETRRMIRQHSAVRSFVVGLFIGNDRDTEVRQGMESTLARIKRAAEGSASSTTTTRRRRRVETDG